MTNMNEFINELEDNKALIEMFESNRKGNNKSVDGNKLSSLAVKIASRIETDNKNIKILASLCLLAIGSNIEPAPAQKLITKALGLLS